VTETRTLIFDRTTTLEQSVKQVKDHVDRRQAQETFDFQKIENRLNLLDGIKQSLGLVLNFRLTKSSDQKIHILTGVRLSDGHLVRIANGAV